MHEFEKSVVRYAGEHGLFPSHGIVLVALSGGGDSVALLRCLTAVADQMCFTLQAAHLNHALRGDESIGDEIFCRELCDALGIELTVGVLEKGVLEKTGESLETSARRVRRDFLISTAGKLGASRIATGHTADDRAETILQRMIRGTGVSGLVGIRPLHDMFIRPFLGMTRSSVRDYLEDKSCGWREDSTNTDTKVFRNRIRHELLPLLESCYSPGVVGALNRLGELSGTDEDYFENRVEDAIGECLFFKDLGKILLDGGTFGSYHTSLRRRIIRRCLELLGGEGRDTDMREVERIISIADKGLGETDGTGGVRAGAGGGVLVFMVTQEIYSPRPLIMPGFTRIPGNGSIHAITHEAEIQPDSSGYVSIESETIERFGTLTVGPALHGEYMKPSGEKVPRKVFDILSSYGIPGILRNTIPVIRAGGVPVWIPGVACSEYMGSGCTGREAITLMYSDGPDWHGLRRVSRAME